MKRQKPDAYQQLIDASSIEEIRNSFYKSLEGVPIHDDEKQKLWMLYSGRIDELKEKQIEVYRKHMTPAQAKKLLKFMSDAEMREAFLNINSDLIKANMDFSKEILESHIS